MSAAELPPQFSPEMQALFADIDVVAEEALHTAAAKYNVAPDVAHLQQLCLPVTMLMTEALRARGYSLSRPRGDRRLAKVGWVYGEPGTPLDLETEAGSTVPHHYPVIEIDENRENDIVADATWQQFLTDEQRGPLLPKVLVGTRSYVLGQLQSFGLSNPDLLAIWAPRHNENVPPKPHSIH